jgi:NAD(P)-dependent dehydrogenase (short-subunit alcohol dehydrogenase family)
MSFGPRGLRVNAVPRGPTRTPGTEPMGDGIDQMASTLPARRGAARRAASAEEIAAAVVFLASDEASFLYGAILPADGGRVAI